MLPPALREVVAYFNITQHFNPYLLSHVDLNHNMGVNT